MKSVAISLEFMGYLKTDDLLGTGASFMGSLIFMWINISMKKLIYCSLVSNVSYSGMNEVQTCNAKKLIPAINDANHDTQPQT